MFNILALGFYCQLYKKKPNIRIFFNDIFIDEFDIDSHDFKTASIPSLKFYQLDLPDVKEHSIKLEVKNNDSNYNNGFMTKSTLIKLHTCNLVPCDDYQYVFNKIYSNNTITSKETDIINFNLIPYLVWKNEQQNLIKNVSHLTIGGSGTFTCDLIKYINILRPISVVPSHAKKVEY